MKDSNQLDRLDCLDLTIEGNEDLSVRPWKGPSPLKINPIVGDAASLSHENLYVVIVNDEDLTLRPWRQATAMPTGSGAAPGPIESQVERAVSGHGVSQQLRFDRIEGVAVLSFVDAEAVTAESIDEIGNTLLAQIDVEKPIMLLLNFSNVRYLSAAALGKLINLKKKVMAVKGKLKLCCIHPDLLEAFRISRLDQVFEIYEDERSALDES
jgi:anti-sigma B factor antagonist